MLLKWYTTSLQFHAHPMQKPFEILCKCDVNLMQVIRKPSADHTQILAHPVQIIWRSYANLNESCANPLQSLHNPVQILPEPMQILCTSYANPIQNIRKPFANPLLILADPMQIPCRS